MSTMDYQTRLTLWQDELTTNEFNIKLGAAMKSKGGAILASIEIDPATKKLAKEIEAKDLAALAANCTRMIAEGIRIEGEARRNLSQLRQNPPLEY